MRRSLLFSCALHGLFALIVLATTARRADREPADAAEIVFAGAAPAAPAVTVPIDVLAHAGGGGPSHPVSPAVLTAARAQRRRPVALRAIATDAPPASEPASGPAAPSVADDGLVEATQAAPAPGATGDQAATAGDAVGVGAGDGLGGGFGDGFGDDSGGKAMSRELHARVLGNEVVDVRPREDAPTISHEEATALRTRDSFPRLPESVWPEWRPYLVKLEICVAADGRVREAVLRSSASPRLDPVVRAAAMTWQYRPRLVDGRAAPFCHGVVIKYERW